MNEKVMKRRNSIINVAYILMLLGLTYVAFKYLLGVVAPFLIAFLVAVCLQRPLRKIDKKTKGKGHTLSSIALVVLLIAIFTGPVILILILVGKQIANFVSYLMSLMSDIPALLNTLEDTILNLINFLPDSIYASVSESIIKTFNDLQSDFNLSSLNIDFKSIFSTVSSSITGVYSVVKGVPGALIGIVIGIIACIFFTKDYNQIVGFIKLQLPDGKKNILTDIKQVFSKTILKMIRAYAIIMSITFGEIFIGLSILNLIGVMNNSYVVMIAIAIAIFDILPVAGSGGILIPWALISLLTGNVPKAIGIIVIYVVISIIRQYIEPKVVGSSLGVHPIVTLAGLYFGLKLFGVLGMFIVPIGVMTIKAFNDSGRIHLYKTPERN